MATHSVGTLRAPGVRRHVVDRSLSGAAVLRSDIDEAALRDAGITPEELLLLTQVFVLVEGHHDELVLNRLFADEFERLGAKVLPTSGVVGLESALNSRFLLERSTARLLIVTDNISPLEVQRLLDELTRLCRTGQVPEAIRHLQDSDVLDQKITEEQHLRKALMSAVSAGRLDRIDVHPLPAPDILDYLPPEAYGLDRTWAQLRQRNDEHHGGKNFKRFLKKNYSIDFSRDEVILRGLAKMDSPPGDLTGSVDATRTSSGVAVQR